eukprot:2545043-Rhodomonas_salina.1
MSEELGAERGGKGGGEGDLARGGGFGRGGRASQRLRRQPPSPVSFVRGWRSWWSGGRKRGGGLEALPGWLCLHGGWRKPACALSGPDMARRRHRTRGEENYQDSCSLVRRRQTWGVHQREAQRHRQQSATGERGSGSGYGGGHERREGGRHGRALPSLSMICSPRCEVGGKRRVVGR